MPFTTTASSVILSAANLKQSGYQNGPHGYAQGGAIFNSGGNGGGIISDITDVRFYRQYHHRSAAPFQTVTAAKSMIFRVFLKTTAPAKAVFFIISALRSAASAAHGETADGKLFFNLDDNSDRPGHIGTISDPFLNNTASCVIYNMRFPTSPSSAPISTGNTVGGSVMR